MIPGLDCPSEIVINPALASVWCANLPHPIFNLVIAHKRQTITKWPANDVNGCPNRHLIDHHGRIIDQCHQIDGSAAVLTAYHPRLRANRNAIAHHKWRRQTFRRVIDNDSRVIQRASHRQYQLCGCIGTATGDIDKPHLYLDSRGRVIGQIGHHITRTRRWHDADITRQFDINGNTVGQHLLKYQIRVRWAVKHLPAYCHPFDSL